MPLPPPLSLLNLPLSLLLLLLLPLSLSTPNDTHVLTLFRLQTDTHAALLTNWTGPSACAAYWVGVTCSSATGSVISLSLPSYNLRGPGLLTLSLLPHLTSIDLHANRLNGSLSPLSNLTQLRLLYLSNNDFSGPIPPEFSSLRHLLRLDLSNNNLQGNIPRGLTRLKRLLTLRLQDNVISGLVPDFSVSLVNLSVLNLTNNELSGHLPEGLLRRFGYQSFLGNAGLCGADPLPRCSPPGKTEKPVMDRAKESGGSDKKGMGLSPGAILAIVLVNCVILALVVAFLVAKCRGSSPRGSSLKGGSEGGKRRSSSSHGSDHKVYASGGVESDGTSATDKSKLVFFERRKQFELEDLLRASAEMLGKGSLGSVYRAVLDDGFTVAVKRLRDTNPCGRNEFEQYMDVIGKLKHQNIVKLRAYYYAKEEKLLVYDYLPNGSLHALLHGNRGPGRIPLDWTTRIGLALGAARGLAQIHEYGTGKIPHGNIKSSNILLDKNGAACVADFGLSLLLNPAHVISRLGGYQAPEQAESKTLSQKADIYSFGVLLLELITGRAPSRCSSTPDPYWEVEEESKTIDLPTLVQSMMSKGQREEIYDQELMRYKNIEGELMSMLDLGLACVVPEPDKRPTMAQVVKKIQSIRADQSPQGKEYDESRDSLSQSVSTTEDEMAGC